MKMEILYMIRVSVKIKETPNTYKLPRLAGNIFNILKNKEKEYGREFADEFLKALKENIRENKFADRLPALSPITIERKGHKTHWLDRGELVDGFEKREETSGSWLKFVVGAFDDVYHYNGVPMATLAKFLEFGTRHIPARPIFALTAQQFKDKTERVLSKKMEKDITRQVGKL
jgi:HK97 gp10 family phage protein